METVDETEIQAIRLRLQPQHLYGPDRFRKAIEAQVGRSVGAGKIRATEEIEGAARRSLRKLNQTPVFSSVFLQKMNQTLIYRKGILTPAFPGSGSRSLLTLQPSDPTRPTVSSVAIDGRIRQYGAMGKRYVFTLEVGVTGRVDRSRIWLQPV